MKESFDMDDKEAAEVITCGQAGGRHSPAEGIVIPGRKTGLSGRFRHNPNGIDVLKVIASWVANRQAESFIIEATMTPGDAGRPGTPAERLKSGLSTAYAG